MAAYIQDKKLTKLKAGMVIPAVPLLLTESLELDEKRQRTLIRYYLDSGVGGLAAAVHTTQFEIRQNKQLHESLLHLVKEEVETFEQRTGNMIILVGGVRGNVDEVAIESEMLCRSGYDAALICPSPGQEADELLDVYRAAAGYISLFGFYLQTAIGGPTLPYEFWREVLTIPELIGIKTAPFDRYKTLDVIRAVADSGRSSEIALYTGNDDSIVTDLLSRYRFGTTGEEITFSGGLLGHWCVWTKGAVELLEEIKAVRSRDHIPAGLLTRAAQVTDANSAFFDAAHRFKGSIAGLHEVLRRQGFLEKIICLNPEEHLSENQAAEIDRVYASYPHLNDDGFINANRQRWADTSTGNCT